ncbi:SCO4402 family protein [Candidatus Tisiphia endosymbiont of Xenochironomus xenolabis]|uniref:SCO4402 family protein n=1 Tax=unclassified Candidatus Tisiphia TaxID=2996318 RepID=UPI0035C8FD52
MIIKFLSRPQFRMEIESAFECLADYEWQMQEWVEKRTPNQYWYGLLYYVLDSLYNMCDLDEYKESNIGDMLYDEDEAQQIHRFCKWFSDLLDFEIGERKPNTDYLNHPEWSKVYTGAKEMYELMDRNDKKYHFSEIANG